MKILIKEDNCFQLIIECDLIELLQFEKITNEISSLKLDEFEFQSENNLNLNFKISNNESFFVEENIIYIKLPSLIWDSFRQKITGFILCDGKGILNIIFSDFFSFKFNVN